MNSINTNCPPPPFVPDVGFTRDVPYSPLGPPPPPSPMSPKPTFRRPSMQPFKNLKSSKVGLANGQVSFGRRRSQAAFILRRT